jgi:dTDP-4-dehydrorhamnose reductase
MSRPLAAGQADLSDPAACAAAIRAAAPDVVINAAAYTAVDKAGDRRGARATVINGDAPRRDGTRLCGVRHSAGSYLHRLCFSG